MKKNIFILSALLILSSNIFCQGKSGNYELIWSDEFNYTGLPDSTKWGYDVGGHGWGNDELQYYTNARKENAFVENGVLTITARKEDYKGKGYTSTRLITQGKGDFLYGRFELRAKLPRGRGTWPAGWMLSTDWSYGAWPESGEIDILEHVGYDMGVQHVSFHSLKNYWKTGTQKTAIMKLDKIDSTFYNYAVEWTPDSLSAFVNDSLYLTVHRDTQNWKVWPFNKPFYLLLNIAVGGSWGASQGVDETIWPQKLTFDYVRVYKLKEKKDTEKPSDVTELRTNITHNRVNLIWEPSYDNYAVKEYIITANGKLVGTTVLNNFEVTGLKPGKLNTFTVQAIDYQGNVSKAVSISATTAKTNTVKIPAKIEAEKYSIQKGISVEPCSDGENALDVSWFEPNDILEYSINPIQKSYTLTVQAATERIDGVIEILNQENKKIGQIKIDNTRSWQAWKPFTSEPFILKSGPQTIKLKCTGDRISLNWIEFK